MTIRPAESRDAAVIAEIVRASYIGLAASHIPYDMPLYHAGHHAEAMADPATRWALLSTEGQPVGVAMWRLLPGIAHLHLLFVAGEHHGQGFGMRLLRHHQQEARREQPDTRLFTLHCLRDSQWAMRFYKRHGYLLYAPGDEWHVSDLHLWIDACRRHDNGWPLKSNKALLYKHAKG